jgi:hypothetical protein
MSSHRLYDLMWLESYILVIIKLIGNPRRSRRVNEIADLFGFSFCPPCVKIFVLLYLTTFINTHSKRSCFWCRTWKWRTSTLAANVTPPVIRVCPCVIYTWRRHLCVFLIWMKAWTYISDLSDSREKLTRHNKGEDCVSLGPPYLRDFRISQRCKWDLRSCRN